MFKTYFPNHIHFSSQKRNIVYLPYHPHMKSKFLSGLEEPLEDDLLERLTEPVLDDPQP